MIHPGVSVGKKNGKMLTETVKQGNNFELLLHSQKNISFLTACILSGTFNDVDKEFYFSL